MRRRLTSCSASGLMLRLCTKAATALPARANCATGGGAGALRRGLSWLSPLAVAARLSDEEEGLVDGSCEEGGERCNSDLAKGGRLQLDDEGVPCS